MDNSPENQPGPEQKPEIQTDTGYQQYLDDDQPAKKRRRTRIILAAAAGVVLLIIISLVFILVGTRSDKNDRQAAETVIVECTDENCFNDHYKQCLPAIYTYDQTTASVKYSITGNGEIGCNVTLEYQKAQYDPDVVGKKMNCDFDTTTDFHTAAQNAMNFPGDYGCQGDLADLLQASSDASGNTE